MRMEIGYDFQGAAGLKKRGKSCKKWKIGVETFVDDPKPSLLE